MLVEAMIYPTIPTASVCTDEEIWKRFKDKVFILFLFIYFIYFILGIFLPKGKSSYCFNNRNFYNAPICIL
jgi:hypothetical protein